MYTIGIVSTAVWKDMELADTDRILPTPERARRGVEILDEVVTYRTDGIAERSASVPRSIDILAAMERRGTITPEMRLAGMEFQEQFRLANIDALAAADLLRAGTQGRAADPEIFSRARESVWKSLRAVGGLGSAGGSCIWHVLGWQHSIKQWAISQAWRGKPIHEKVAAGILICALGTLAKQKA
jgi:hypothetical protein